MQKSLDIFKADPQSVFDVLCDRKNTGFYMPAYQRPYSWEEAHIKDLFSDCDNVFRNLLDSSDAIIFLGSILSVDDSGAQTIYPLAKRHTPTHIKLIIDGQQRLSTLAIIIMCLNERLRFLLPKLKKSIEDEVDDDAIDTLENLREIVSQSILDTSNFVIETTAEHSLYKYLPKIIRSQLDCWGKDEKNAVYESPISELLISYQRHIIESDGSTIFKEIDLSVLSDSCKRVVNNVKEIRRQLNCIQNGFQFKNQDEDGEEKLLISDFVNVDTLDICLDFPIDESLLKASKNNTKIQDIIFITAFTKFLLHRVCLTFVEVNNESYAFDMFEALNTTGEPLTAIETFVPKVIEHIGYKRNEGEPGVDEAMLSLNSITDRFERMIKSKDKNDKTKALILAFIRAYDGRVKVTSLRDQRDAMLKSYEQCAYVNKDEYLAQLGSTAKFLFDHWQSPVPDVNGLVSNSDLDTANVCLRYLVDMKHDIVQPLLIQFMLQDEKYQFVGNVDSSFIKVLKAITAFSVLWRAMSGGADGIDGVYKKLHEKGFDISGVHSKAYKLKDSTISSEEFNVDAVKAFFVQELESKIIDKESPKDGAYEKWLDICSKQPLLTKSKSIKLLLLAGFHGVKLEGENFIRSEEPITQFITPIMWELVSNKDRIKKVYSGGTSSSGWSDPNIFNPEVFNKLGNVLVDARDNIITSSTKTSWYSIKQNMLDALSNDSLENINSIFSEKSIISDEAKRHASILLLESKYEEVTFADEWDKNAIDERTMLLLKNAWTNLNQWLK
ncbi:DUF262 domain-containing protein [Shewanella frigidimarina]|uniref:WW domain-containing protein n=1 Tax=Shewanella frigidimarina (strain NCIMB 400) TaxID=318167 RepID=Q081Y1_SHEFN|nr:DUF262 domain-containing protein [Shewanella frigidimarina]ABI71934.1 protein of unknown function DUF262 [Shewanella frigidimarina NCIMB 400]